MKPVLVISHAACERAGYLCEYLGQRNISYERIRHEQGESIPEAIHNLSGLVFLGSPSSVNDSLGWIREEMALIKSALVADIPVLGICFGAQLLAKALGARVVPAPGMQIGWHPVTLTQQGHAIFDDAGLPDHFLAFEWHGDTFSLPGDATPVFTGECIEQQGFVFKNCLAVQFHPEVTKAMIHEWIDRYAHCLEKPALCTQGSDEILGDIEQRLAAQRKIADRLFDWWLNRVCSCSHGIRQQVTRH